LQDSLKKTAGYGVRAHVIQVVETAMRTAVDGVLPGVAMRAGAGALVSSILVDTNAGS
jgi:hypothetical protein